VAATKKRKADSMGQNLRRTGGVSKRARPSDGGATSVDTRLGRLTAYAGYVGAVVLIYQSINGFSEQPAWGFTWSPAVLGVILGVVTALFRNELNLRSRLKVFDEETASRPVVAMAWAIPAIIAILAITTLPRF
jgi:hypothetical protein